MPDSPAPELFAVKVYRCNRCWCMFIVKELDPQGKPLETPPPPHRRKIGPLWMHEGCGGEILVL